MKDKFILVDHHSGVTTLRLNRPQAYNAFHLPMIQDLAGILIGLARDRDTRDIIITGQVKAFCAGGDLRWVQGGGREPAAAFHELAAFVEKRPPRHNRS